MAPERAGPHIPSWRNREQLLRLIGEICPHCLEKIFPPRDVCPHCSQPVKAARKTCRPPDLLIYSPLHEPH